MFSEEAEFDEIIDDLARQIVDRVTARRDPSQVELRVAAQALYVLGDFAAAEASYRQALEQPGPDVELIRTELAAVQRKLRLEAVRRRD